MAANASNAILDKKFTTKDYPNLYNFGQLSLEEIAEISKNSDPSRYWKLGDYKIQLFENPLYQLTGKNLLTKESINVNEYINIYQLMKFLIEDKSSGLNIDPTSTNIVCNYIHESTPDSERYYLDITYNDSYYEYQWRSDWQLPDNTGIDFYIAPNMEFKILYITEIIQIPLTIIGFNHDQVSNPSDYGKSKAGVTISIGAPRKVRHGSSNINNLSPDLLAANEWYSIFSNYETANIANNLFKNNFTSFKSPNDFVNNNKNIFWSDSPLRNYLNTYLKDILFKDTNIDFVTVDKYNVSCWSPAQFYTNSYITQDKVFLPSENEIFGRQRFYSHSYDYPYEYRNKPLISKDGVEYTGAALTIDYQKLQNIAFLTCFNDVSNKTYLNRSIFTYLIKHPVIFIKRFSDKYGSSSYKLYCTINGTSLAPDLTPTGIFWSKETLANYGINVNDESFAINDVYCIRLPELNYSIAPAIEGEQYKLFEETGSSKFFWSTRYLETSDGQTWTRKTGPVTSGILLRSSDNRIQNGSSPNNAMIVNSVNNESSNVNYGLGLATSITTTTDDELKTTNLDILPCFCL